MARLTPKPKWWLDAKGVEDAVRKASIGRIEQAALLIEREAKTSMRSGGGAAKIRSSPGEPPRVQTGVLRASIQSAKLDEITWIIGPTTAAPYGKRLEFGTRNMLPRPFMFPALLKVIPKFRDLFKNLDLGRFYKAQRIVRDARVGPI